MNNNSELFESLKQLSEDKGLESELLIEKIQTALIIAIKKDYPRTEKTKFDVDIKKGKFDVFLIKNVVEDVEDEANQISLEEANGKYLNNGTTGQSRYKIGNQCIIQIDTRNFGRIAAQTARQVMKQGIKEVERQQLIEQWGGLENEAVTALVTDFDPSTGNVQLNITGSEVTLFKIDQIPGERLQVNDRIKVLISGVSVADRRPTLKVSRSNRELVRRMFELEVPEIKSGVVEIMAISREAGLRSKIAVKSNDENVEAVGSCIGPRRSRITSICEELGGEKIDVIQYSDNDLEFIKQSLKPAEVVEVVIPDDAVSTCSVYVPENQLSLAIGNKGLNAKLAAKLTGFKIDIKAVKNV